MPYYKLTNQKMQTRNGFQWKLGKWYKIDKTKRYQDVLCSDSWFHCYNNPLLAVMFNPIHAKIKNPRLFRVSVKGKGLSDNGTKFGFPYMKLVEEIPLPEITPVQRIAFAILCTKETCKNEKWNKWADNWLSGSYRNINADAAYAAAYAAADAARTAAYTADAAAYAAARISIDLISLIQKAMKYK